MSRPEIDRIIQQARKETIQEPARPLIELQNSAHKRLERQPSLKTPDKELAKQQVGGLSFKRSQIVAVSKVRGMTPKHKIEVIIDGDDDNDYMKDEEPELSSPGKQNENKLSLKVNEQPNPFAST